MNLKEIWEIIKSELENNIILNEDDIEMIEWNYRLDHFDVMNAINKLIKENKIERIWVVDEIDEPPFKKLRYILRLPSFDENQELLTQDEIEQILKG